MVFNMREGLNNKKEYLQKAVIELAIFILCILSTISIKMQLYVIYEETDGFLGNVQRTLYSFQGWGIENFLITIGLFYIYIKVWKNEKFHKDIAILSLLFSVFKVLGECYAVEQGGDFSYSHQKKYSEFYYYDNGI